MKYLINPGQAARYRITVQGHIDRTWSDWFGGMRIALGYRQEAPVSTLDGMVADQSALHGVLNRLHDLGLALLVVEYLS